MALLPARRSASLSRSGSQAPARWVPFAEFEDLYQRMGQLMSGAFDGGWQPLGQSWSPLADLSGTDEAYRAEAELPGVAKDDISVELTGQELVISGEFKDTQQAGRALRRGATPAGSSTGCCCPATPKVTAALANGVLMVTVPRLKPARQPDGPAGICSPRASPGTAQQPDRPAAGLPGSR
jgi:HSP20 family protein